MTDTRYHDAVRWSLQDAPRAGWNNRYFMDTEFTDFRTCELISLAVVSESGHEFYAERTDFDRALPSDFVRAAVLPQLGQFEGRAMPLAALRATLRAWLLDVPGKAGPVLCYDHEMDLVLFRHLLGGSLPRGWRVENIAGSRDPSRYAAYYARHGGEHHALHDARASAYAHTR